MPHAQTLLVHAKRVLLEATMGHDVNESAHALAEAVLSTRTATLARLVQEAGPHSVSAAVELAGLILAASMNSAGKGSKSD